MCYLIIKLENMRGDNNMCYIFVDGDIYLGMNNKNYIPVKNKADAKRFPTKSNAQNMLQSSVPKILKRTYSWNLEEIEEVEISNSTTKVNTQYTHVDIDDLKESINSLSGKLSTLKGNKEWLLEEESNLDKQISDILHFLEFNTFSACEGYKLCKALKELRLKRREVKNELEIINILNCHTCNNIANGNTNKAISGISNKHYTPRVLTELFEQRSISNLIN